MYDLTARQHLYCCTISCAPIGLSCCCCYYNYNNNNNKIIIFIETRLYITIDRQYLTPHRKKKGVNQFINTYLQVIYQIFTVNFVDATPHYRASLAYWEDDTTLPCIAVILRRRHHITVHRCHTETTTPHYRASMSYWEDTTLPRQPLVTDILIYMTQF